VHKILVIEDQKDIRDNVKELLEQKEYQVEAAIDADSGFEIAKLFLPDLILSDLMLPDHSGIDLIKRLKEHEKLKDIPVIIITGHSQQEIYRNSMTQGADDFIVKPFKAKELFDAVNAQLSKAKIRKQDYRLIAELSEQSPLAILRLNENGEIVYSNPAAKFLENQQLIKELKQLINQEIGDHFEFEFPIAEKIFNCIVSYNSDQKYHNVYFIDNTAQKNAFSELESQNTLIERKNQNLSQFTYIVAHDLKAPVINIRQLLDLLLQDYHLKAKTKEKDHVLMGLLNESLNKLETVMEDVSGILKAREESAIQKKVIFSVAKYVKKSVNEFKNVLNEIEADISINIESSLKLNFPLTDFSTILYNLIENAIKFKDPNRSLSLNFTASETHDEIILKIKDNGLGFDEKIAKGKLFVFYQRMHSQIEGKGLGLQLVRNIMDSHGGQVHFISEAGAGSTFLINFKK
jgi:DNA-binding response OmpR family regulator/anti-sigma regulatory factor (Ser/Thr protein kinase)